MTKKFFAILALALATLPMLAQPQQWNHPNQGQQRQGGQQHQQQRQGGQQQQQRKFDPQEFTKRMEGYIAMKAGLSREESDKFFPIYREFKDKQRELTFKQQELKRKKTANDKEYETVLTNIANLSIQIAKLEQTYYPKMCKVIPAKKVFVAIQAENDFHRDMVRQPYQWGNMPGMPTMPGNGQRPQQWGGQQQQQKK